MKTIGKAVFFALFTLTICTANTVLAMPNPAAVYCEKLGYEYKIVKAPDGGQKGICVAAPGVEFDAWAFYQGEVGNEYSYGARYGYDTVSEIITNGSIRIKQAVCIPKKNFNGQVRPLSGKNGKISPAINTKRVRIPMLELMEQNGEPLIDTNRYWMPHRTGKATTKTSSTATGTSTSSQLTSQSSTSSSSSTLPSSFDWRNYNGSNWMTAVKDQGGCGSCWAFGAVGAVEAKVKIDAGNPYLDCDLSEEQLVSCSGAGSCDGGDSSGALDYIRDTGITDEGCFPYTVSMVNNWSVDCSNKCDNWQEKAVKITAHQGVDCSSVENVKQVIMNYGPIAMTCDGNKLYYDDVYLSGANIGHEIVIVGWVDAENAWLVKNSWGSGWGDSGYGKLKYWDAEGAECISHTIIPANVSPSLCFSSSTYEGFELTGQYLGFNITVLRTWGSQGTVTVDYATSDGTAIAGRDYTSTSGTFTFAPGETVKTFNVPILYGPSVDGTKTVNLTLSNPTGGIVLGSPATAQVIIHDPGGNLQLTSSSYTVGPDAAVANLAVQVSGYQANTVTVDYATSDLTAMAGQDYTATSGTLTFGIFENEKIFTVPITAGQTADNKTMNLTLSNPGGGASLVDPSTAVVTILPGSHAGSMVQFQSSAYTVNENDGTATITVERTNDTSSTITVDYSTGNGTAWAWLDYTPTCGTLTFASGESKKTFSVSIFNDQFYEGNRTVNLTLSNPSPGAALVNPINAVLTIIEDDPQGGLLQFSSAGYTVAENAGPALVTVNRTGTTDEAVTVDYSTSDGTATAGRDYTATNGTLTFASWETQKTFTIPIIDNDICDGDKVINLTLSNPTGGAGLGSTNTAVLTINDDENITNCAGLQFSSTNYTVNENDGSATITVTRVGKTDGTATVNYATQNPVNEQPIIISGSTVFLKDYQVKVNVAYETGMQPDFRDLRFVDGNGTNLSYWIESYTASSNATVWVKVSSIPTYGTTIYMKYGDPTATSASNEENTFVFFDDFTGANGSAPNPAKWSVAAQSVAINNGKLRINAGSVNSLLTVPQPCVVEYDYTPIADGTQYSDFSHYLLKFGTTDVNIAFNHKHIMPEFNNKIRISDAAGNCMIPPVDNPAVTLGTTYKIKIVVDSINKRIQVYVDDVLQVDYDASTETFGTRTINMNQYLGEDDVGNYRIRQYASPEPTALVLPPTTATADKDYMATSGTLTFAPGETQKTFTVPVNDDNIYEGDRAMDLVLSNPTGTKVYLGTPSTAALTIHDNETSGFQFSSATCDVVETTGSTTITVTRLGDNSGTATVDYSTSDGTATAGRNYTTTSGTLTFAAGETQKTFTVPILDDGVSDGDETFNLALSNPTGGAVLETCSTAVITIHDNDGGSLQFSSSTYDIAETAGNAVITVTRTGKTGGTLSVNYSTRNGTATAGQNYTATSGTLTFAPGETQKTFTVPILDDGISDGDGTIYLTLSNPTGSSAVLGTPSTAILTVHDNDGGSLHFSSATYDVPENAGNATIMVARTGKTGGTVSVHYSTSNGGAMADQDYTAASGTLTFAPGETQKTFTVPIIDNDIYKANETVNLTLSEPTGSGVALGTPSTAIITIHDNDARTMQFSSATYYVTENAGNATITVNRTGQSSGIVTVDYHTSNGSGTANQDYTATNGTLTFAAGETQKTFTVPIIGNNIAGGTKTVNLTLSNPTGNGAFLGSPSTAVLCIQNANTCTLQFLSPTFDVGEGDSNAIITVVCIGQSSGTITVHYSTSNGSATAGQDYTATNGILTFALGETSKTFTVPIIDDNIIEGDETINLALSSPTGTGAILGTPSTATLTIHDNDGDLLQFSSSTYDVVENAGNATITVARVGDNSYTATVDYSISDGTATAGQDYTATSGTLTFAPGETNKTFTVSVINDDIYKGDRTINLVLSNPTGTNTSLGSPTNAVLTIHDDNGGILQFLSPTNNVVENAGKITIRVVRTARSSGVVTVDYSTSDGTAIAGQDYTTTSGTLTFASGETQKTFTVPIIDNQTKDGNRTLNLTLSNPAGSGAVLGSPSTSIVTIYDDDAGPFFMDLGINLATNIINGSAVWGDYNNDGYPDVAVCGYGVSKIFRNNGDGTFTDIGATLTTSSWYGACAWGDYNNDGRLDLAISGSNGTCIYRNDGNDVFTDIGVRLPSVTPAGAGAGYGSIAWGDYNNDGKLDLALSEGSSSSCFVKVFKNNGDGTFTDIGATGFTGVTSSSIAWGDYDNDGYPDLAVSGIVAGNGGYITQIYKNNRDGTFTSINTGWSFVADPLRATLAWGDYNNDGNLDLAVCGLGILKNNGDGTFTNIGVGVLGIDGLTSLAWGDYDNDGYLDLVVSGTSNTTVYKNNGNDTFTDIQAGLPATMRGSVAWGDYDNDGNIDLLLNSYYSVIINGKSVHTNFTKIYKSVGQKVNTSPSAPTNLTCEVGQNDVKLKWSPGSDAETPTNGLYYNLRVGTTPGGNDIVSGAEGSPLLGNYLRPKLSSGQLGVRLNLPYGTYYWSVQTIDTGLKASDWSNEGKLIINTNVISGKITLGGGASNVTDVLLTLTGDATNAIHPDANGNYAFTNMDCGNYIITPSLEDYYFFPASSSCSVSTNVQPSQDFTGLYRDYDSDGDGLPDWWELTYFGNLNQGPNDDPDNDGYTNLEEYQNNTNPTNSAGNPSLSISGHITLVPPYLYKPISITGSGSSLFDYQVKVSVAYEPEMQPDFHDLRFTDSYGNNLNYWIESYTASSNAIVWVKVPAIPTFGTTINMQYGDPTVAPASNTTNTFIFFDDFTGANGSVPNSANWTVSYPPVAITNNKLRIGPSASLNNAAAVSSSFVVPQPCAVEYDYTPIANTSGGYPFFGHCLFNLGTKPVYVDFMRSSGYQIVLNGASMQKSVNNPATTLGTTYKIKIVVDSVGKRIQVYVNDVLKLDYDASAQTFGTRTITMFQNGGTDDVDNYRIRNYASPEPAATVGNRMGGRINDVRLALTGAATNTVHPSQDGSYIVSKLINDTYTVTPSLNNYHFLPASLSCSVSGSNQTNQDFIGLYKDYDSDADGLPDWWELTYFGNLSQGPNDDPDGDGYTNLEEYTRGSNPNDPESIPLYAISGHVTLKGGASNATNAVLTLTGAATNATTRPDSAGNYTFTNLKHGSYTITSSLGDYHFFPASCSSLIQHSDQANQDFAGLYKDYDSDGDGLPDWWELTYFGSLNQGPNDDFDGDGYTNLQEYNAGSNPGDPNSIPLYSISGKVTLGSSVVWVKAPSITPQASNVIYMYYGNANAQDAQDKTAVWSDNYLMVQHLNEKTGLHYDSTSNHKDATAYNLAQQGADIGEIGRADAFDSTLGSYLYVTGSGGLDYSLPTRGPLTVTAWFKADGNNNSTIVSHWESFNCGPSWNPSSITCSFGWQLALAQTNNAINLYLACPNNPTVTVTGAKNVKDGNWHCASFVRHDRDYQLFIDGQLEGGGVQSSSLTYSGQRFQIGSRYNLNINGNPSAPGGYFNGVMDEVRVSSTDRSADWMEASFLSENNQLITVGDEESITGQPWQYRRPIYIVATNISETLTNFPICVKLDSSRITYTGSGGADIRFTDTSGNPLKYEIESWNEGGTPDISDVVLTLTGAATGTVHPDKDGNYIFTNLIIGAYSITPSLENYNLTPASRSYPYLDLDQADQNFNAVPQ